MYFEQGGEIVSVCGVCWHVNYIPQYSQLVRLMVYPCIHIRDPYLSIFSLATFISNFSRDIKVLSLLQALC